MGMGNHFRLQTSTISEDDGVVATMKKRRWRALGALVLILAVAVPAATFAISSGDDGDGVGAVRSDEAAGRDECNRAHNIPACDEPEAGAGAQPIADTKVTLAPIESVEIMALAISPPEYAASAVSGLPNGCIKYKGYEVTRVGDTVRVTVSNTAPVAPDVICTMQYGTVSHSIPLGGGFEPGETYTVEVNGVVRTFTP